MKRIVRIDAQWTLYASDEKLMKWPTWPNHLTKRPADEKSLSHTNTEQSKNIVWAGDCMYSICKSVVMHFTFSVPFQGR